MSTNTTRWLVKTTFLQGNKFSRDAYSPTEANCENKFLWKLRKCVYGSSDASLQWYHHIKTFVLSNGGNVSERDAIRIRMFTWDETKSLIGVINVHADDFLFAGTEKLQHTIRKN